MTKLQWINGHIQRFWIDKIMTISTTKLTDNSFNIIVKAKWSW